LRTVCANNNQQYSTSTAQYIHVYYHRASSRAHTLSLMNTLCTSGLAHPHVHSILGWWTFFGMGQNKGISVAWNAQLQRTWQRARQAGEQTRDNLGRQNKTHRHTLSAAAAGPPSFVSHAFTFSTRLVTVVHILPLRICSCPIAIMICSRSFN
jgi:hypothetical protein